MTSEAHARASFHLGTPSGFTGREGGGSALGVVGVGVDREHLSGGVPHRDGMMAERLRGRASRPGCVAGRDRQGHIREALRVLALALDGRDDVHRLQCARQVSGDAIEKGLTPSETAGVLGTLHAKYAQHVVAHPQRTDMDSRASDRRPGNARPDPPLSTIFPHS